MSAIATVARWSGALLWLTACSVAQGPADASTSGPEAPADAGSVVDAGATDAGEPDAGPSGEADAGTDAPDGGVAALDGGLPIEPGICASAVPAASGSCELRPGSPLPSPRTAAVPVVVGQDVVLVGGQTTNGFRTDEVTIGTVAAGTIGQWREGPALPAKRSNPAVAFHQGKLYVFGGEPGVAAAGADVSTDVFVSTRSTSGSFGAFANGTPLPSARTGMAAAAGTGAIYLVGGGTARGASARDAAVLVARLDASGTITGYDTAGPLPAARSGASAAVVGGRLFVVGGLFDGSGTACAAGTVITAPIEAGGQPGPWAPNTSLPRAPSGAALAVDGNRLYLVGGTTNYGDPAASVLSATVQADGSLTQWRRVATVQDERYGHAAVVTGGRLFVLGGSLGIDVFDEVFSASVAGGNVGCD